jgi:hypothetical protein
MEPPRSTIPILGELRVSMTNGETAIPEPVSNEADREVEEPRARYAENGLSTGEIGPMAPFEHTLTKTVEPW